MSDYLADAQELFEYTRTMRRDFHQYPELGFQEVRTAGIVGRELEALGLDVRTGVAKTGVVALLEGARPGPVILLRFDMDALPIVEATGAEYASRTPGMMHACGHDGHTAVGLTVARMLHAHRDELAGTVKFVFQPAEEGLGGAALMVAEGVLENPKPDYCLATHVWNENPLGWFGITPGPFMAAGDAFYVQITGKGGHGAAPHQTIDPVYAAAQIITTLQSITTRDISPLETAVVSVTSVHGGSSFNITPPDVELQGTIRTFEPEVRTLILKRFREIVSGVAQSLGCETEIEINDLTPAVVNDPDFTARVQEITTSLFPDCIVDTNSPTMGSEDMAFLMSNIPGCFVLVGSANSEKGLDAKHHHPHFDFDEAALVKSAALMASVAAHTLSTR
ncbi:MAG: amidohydrolase [Chloroflexi bacterium]|nr:amidohydrolase [Chloroflexota bacterium]MBU1662700.1 amidohydrolase [Chloroflexota bacterium]